MRPRASRCAGTSGKMLRLIFGFVPLILFTWLLQFLDDLQWCDDVSRQLIHSIVGDARIKNLLLIGTVRQDPSVPHVFNLAPDAVLESSEIILGPLEEKDVNLIVSQATARPLDDTKSLAAVVHRKTGGNAYFVIQYLEMLHREELISFSFRKGRWKWDVDQIASHTDVSDNVVQVLIRKIESLTVDVQVALIVAACLGYSFRVNVVECILGSNDFLDSIPSFLKNKNLELPMSPVNTQIALTKALQVGLIDKLSGNKCKFSHDRVQQSAYAMLPDGNERQRLQAALGKILLEMSRQEDAEDWMLFAAVDLLSTGTTIPSSDSEDDISRGSEVKADETDVLFPELCLEASKKAAQKAAFRSAATYADEGIGRLYTRDARENNYDLWLELSNLSAEMHYSRGDFAASDIVVANILEGSRCTKDCFRAYNVSMHTFIANEDWATAVSTGSRLLRDLGVPTPKNPSMLNVLSLLSKSKRLLKGRKPKDLENLHAMDNPEKAEALFILGATAFCSFCKGDEMRCTVLCLKMFILTLEYGICGDSPYAFAAYGMCMSAIGEYALAYDYGKLAVDMLERPGCENSIAKVLVVVHNHLFFLKSPIQESLEPLLYGYTAGMRWGDVCQAAFCLRARACMGVFAGTVRDNTLSYITRFVHLLKYVISARFVTGVHLAEHEREMLSFCEFYQDFKQLSSMKLQSPWLQLTQNFLGQTEDVLKLSGSAMDEESVFTEITASVSSSTERNPNLAYMFFNTHYAKRALLYSFGEFEMADDDRQQSARLHHKTAIIYASLYDFLFCSLTCLAMARKGKRVRYYKNQSKIYQRELLARAKQGCVNCVPLLALISAEKHALKDKTGDVALYNDAIGMLGRCGFRLFKAIALERAAEYLLECGNEERGKEFLHRAWDEYYDYGAYAKHDQMRVKYSDITEFARRPSMSKSRSSYRLKAHNLKKWKQDV